MKPLFGVTAVMCGWRELACKHTKLRATVTWLLASIAGIDRALDGDGGEQRRCGHTLDCGNSAVGCDSPRLADT
jgi:hypothetical protein